MARPDFDWTFEDAPLEGEARPEAVGAPRPGLTPPARRVRRPWPRWAWLALLGVAAGALLGAYLFTRLGWLQLEGQIAREVAYDDARSRAREVEAVLAAQVNNDAFWRTERTGEVRLGLPAPLPAGNLLPTAYPAEVVAVEPLGDNIFAATVRRRYADAAGQVVSFDLVQRYLNVAPGEWQRMGTDLNGLVAATIVRGARLSATVPINDLPWLKPALTAADGVLIDACAAWQTCPDDFHLPLYFNVGPEFLSPRLPDRPANGVAGAYPIIFDIGASPPGFPPRYLLSAPQVAGRPADAAAQAAYNRALSATLLGYMAGAVAQSARAEGDYFLDALVARMEQRLGLSTAPTEFPVVEPLLFRSADDWWDLDSANQPLGLAERGQVLDLMNVILAGQPPSVDGALLHAVHQPDVLALEPWLEAALPPGEATRALAGWPAHGQQSLTPPTDADWAAAEGLVLACPSGVYIVSQGARRLLDPGFQTPVFTTADLGTRLATERYRAGLFIASGEQSLHYEMWLFDQQPGGQAIHVTDNAYPLGWGADGALYFVDFGSPTNPNFQSPPLLRYDPVTLVTTTVLPAFKTENLAVWSADHQALLFTQMAAADSPGGADPFLMLLAVGPPVTRHVLTTRGYAAAFAPGSTATTGQVAYLSGGSNSVSEPLNLRLHVLDLASGEDRVLFDADAAGGDITDGSNVIWSPGGRWLSFADSSSGRLFIVDVAAGTWREWSPGPEAGTFFFARGFSADDGYLAVSSFVGAGSARTLALVDLSAADSAPGLRLNPDSVAWSPSGHTLAITNALGVFLVDAATGEYHWLQPEPCSLSW